MSRSTLLASSMSQSIERLLVSAKVPSSSPPTWFCQVLISGQTGMKMRCLLLCCCLPLPHQENHLQNCHHQPAQPKKETFWHNFYERCWSIRKVTKFYTSSVHSNPGGDFRGANRGVSSGYPGNGATWFFGLMLGWCLETHNQNILPSI